MSYIMSLYDLHMKEAYRDNALYHMEWIMWMRMRHVISEWGMSHQNEACHIRMRHVLDKESYKSVIWYNVSYAHMYDLRMNEAYVI